MIFRSSSKTCIALVSAVLAAGCGGGGGSSLYDSTNSSSSGSSSTSGGSTAGGGITNVSSGVPTQRSLSLSVEKYALNWAVDGDTTTITARVTDTAGNPVPEGTAVQFSTEGGQIQTSCLLTGVKNGSSTISGCSVTFATQNLRPQDGLVTVLAWLQGQEAYIDLNGNGAYDAGEPFYDSGRIYRDDNVSGTYNSGIDELNVGGTTAATIGIGTTACGVNGGTSGISYTPASFGFNTSSIADFYLGTEPASVPSTCDGVWGNSLIRGSVVLPVSYPPGAGAQIEVVGTRQFKLFAPSANGVNEVSAPAGTALEIVGTLPTGCTASIVPATVPNNQVAASLHFIDATGCSGSLNVRATFSGGSTLSVAVPL